MHVLDRLVPAMALALAAVIVVFMVFLASRQRLFLTPGTAADLFKYYSPMAILALGMTFVILTGGIDLSVGFVMMLLMFVMAAVPCPNMRRLQHGRRPVVAESLVECSLAVVLPVGRSQRIPAKIGSVARDVVAVFVINDPGIVRSIGAVTVSRSPDQRPVGE